MMTRAIEAETKTNEDAVKAAVWRLFYTTAPLTGKSFEKGYKPGMTKLLLDQGFIRVDSVDYATSIEDTRWIVYAITPAGVEAIKQMFNKNVWHKLTRDSSVTVDNARKA
jgi:hypothetical protein